MRRFCLALLWATTLAAVEPARVIPISVRGGNIFISTRLNGSGPLHFLFDSAAGVHAVNWRRAEELKLEMQRASNADGAGDGSTRAAVLPGARLSLDGFALRSARTVATDFDPVGDRKGYRLDGLIGADLMRHWVVEVDHAESVMRLYDPATWRYEGSGDSLPLRVDSTGVAYVTADVHIPGRGLVEAEFKIDSAAGDLTAMFASPFAEKHDLVAAASRAGIPVLADEVMGVGGTSVSWTTRLDAIRLGRTLFRRPVVRITGAKGGTLARSDIAGILGGGLLARFRVIYNCPHARLYLEPGKEIDAPFEEDMSGIRWVAFGPDRNRFRVRAVVPDSPASRAGIAAGDVLIGVDGNTGGTFERQWLRDALCGHGRPVKLTLEREGARRKIAIVLRRMV